MRTLRNLFRLAQAAIIVAVATTATTSLAQAKKETSPARPSDNELMLRTYETGDLVVTVPDYALETDSGAGAIGNGGGYGGGLRGGGGGGMGMGGRGMGGGGVLSVPSPSPITVESLTQVIMETVAPDSWQQTGHEGRITALGATLVVRQTADVHQEIGELLDALRNGSATRRTVAVDVRWLLLDSADLEKLLVPGDDGKTKVDRQVLSEFTRRPTSLRGLTNCFSGQSVYLISGTLRSNVSSYIPVVGSIEPPKPEIMFAVDRSDAPVVFTQLGGEGSAGSTSGMVVSGSVGYQPVITTNNFGAQIELRPTLLHADNAAVVDLKSTITFPGSPSSPDAFESQANPLAPKVDRLAIQTQELATTLRVPLGGSVLVGGMTYMAPAPSSAEDAPPADVQAADRSAEQRQMYLVIELR